MAISKKKIGCLLAPGALFLGLIIFSIFWGAYFKHKKSLTINEPVFTQSIEYYDISGTMAQELNEQINLLGPKDTDSNIGSQDKAGMVTSKIDWDIKTRPKGDGCELGGLILTADFTILYPRWVNQGQGTPDAVERWARFIAALEEHEEQHVADETQKTYEIYDMLLNLPTDLSCEDTIAYAEERTYDLEDKYVAVAKAFDLQSGKDAAAGINDMGALTR